MMKEKYWNALVTKLPHASRTLTKMTAAGMIVTVMSTCVVCALSMNSSDIDTKCGYTVI